VARQADLGYITNHEQGKKGGYPKTQAREKEAEAEKESSGKTPRQ
jgi:hypothetical protein